MSKFCGGISDGSESKNPEDDEHMTWGEMNESAQKVFRQSEKLAREYEEESKEIQHFIATISHNEKQLAEISDTMNQLQATMTEGENDVWNNDENLKHLEKSVLELENVWTQTRMLQTPCRPSESEYAALVDCTDQTMGRMQQWMDEINQCKHFLKTRNDPNKEFTAMLHGQARTMEETNKNMDTLTNKVGLLDDALRVIKCMVSTEITKTEKGA